MIAIAQSGKLLQVFPHERKVRCLEAIDSVLEGKMLLTGSEDGLIRRWNIKVSIASNRKLCFLTDILIRRGK